MKILASCFALMMLVTLAAGTAQEKSAKSVVPVPLPDPVSDERAKPKPLPPLAAPLAELIRSATPLNPDKTVFLDVKEKRVTLRTEVACTDCVLEMLLVPEHNREHETILRIRSKAYVIHTALLALGLEPGKPAQFSPMFVPPSGQKIQVEVVWLDADGKLQRAPVQNWIRRNIHRYYTARLPDGPPPGMMFPLKNLRWDKFNNDLLWYGPMSDAERNEMLKHSELPAYRAAIESFYRDSQSKPMKAAFVFVGSSIYKDEETGEEYYEAEGGHLICTSNFPDAMIDVQEESSASDGSLAYEGWTERIPPQGTPVLLVLTPLK
jgi:hypothetical protein